MRTTKRNKKQSTTLDAIKAMRKGNREAYMEIMGPGFHSTTHIHKSAETYTRKQKHKVKPE